MTWHQLPDGKEKYQMYLNSREWAVKRNAVTSRSGGVCERCKHNGGDHVHHLTYIRKYNERPEDLQHLCEGCHEFIHGRSEADPQVRALNDDLSLRQTYSIGELALVLGGALCSFMKESDYEPNCVRMARNMFALIDRAVDEGDAVTLLAIQDPLMEAILARVQWYRDKIHAGEIDVAFAKAA